MATYRSFGLIISAISALFGMLFMISTQALPVSSVPYFFRTNIMNPDGSTARQTFDWYDCGSCARHERRRYARREGNNPEKYWVIPMNLPRRPTIRTNWVHGPSPQPMDPIPHKITHDLFGVQVLPFVSNITISGYLLKPTITWELPATDVPYTSIKIRVFDFAGGALDL